MDTTKIITNIKNKLQRLYEHNHTLNILFVVLEVLLVIFFDRSGVYFSVIQGSETASYSNAPATAISRDTSNTLTVCYIFTLISAKYYEEKNYYQNKG